MPYYPTVEIRPERNSLVVKNESLVFITVKFPRAIIPQIEKVAVVVHPGERLARVAKFERQLQARSCTDLFNLKGHQIKPKPSALAWAIYANVDDRTPVLTSANWGL